MALDREPSHEGQIDDDAVKRYFDGAEGTSAAAMSVMSHEHNLPQSSVGYRLSRELGIISPWLNAVGRSARVLDVGCGAGAWVELFANRYRSAVGVERSSLMVNAAKERIAHLSNAEVHQGDGRHDLPDGPFELIFLGGLMMYQGDDDVVELLNSLKSRLGKGGTIILRESTVRRGVLALRGEYQVVYRSVDLYQKLFEKAGIPNVEVRRNLGYTCLVIAEELVDLRRNVLPFLPKKSPLLGSLTWAGLRAATPLSFWALPQVLSLLNLPWPKLQNHFFRLQPLQ